MQAVPGATYPPQQWPMATTAAQQQQQWQQWEQWQQQYAQWQAQYGDKVSVCKMLFLFVIPSYKFITFNHINLCVHILVFVCCAISQWTPEMEKKFKVGRTFFWWQICFKNI